MRLPTAILALLALAACSEQPKHETGAVIVRLAHVGSKWDRGTVIVTARTERGLTGTKSVSITRLDCHVGDTIEASAQGVSLTLDDDACVSPGPFPNGPG